MIQFYSPENVNLFISNRLPVAAGSAASKNRFV